MRFETGSEFVSSLVSEHCPEPSISNTVRLQTYFKKAHNLWHQGLDFVKTGKNSHAYVYLMRYSQFVMKLHEHNAWSQKQYTREKNLNKKRLNKAISKLEELKPIIVKEYENEIKMEKEQPKILNNNSNNNDNSINNTNNNNISNDENNINNNNSIIKEEKTNDKTYLPSNKRWSNLLIPNVPEDNNNSNNSINNSSNINSNNNNRSNSSSMDNLFNSGPSQIIIPTDLIPGFVKIASKNTKNDIESCGVLTGKYNSKTDSYSITHCIIPKQKGSANTVQTLHEEELIDIQEKHDLITLGWIHTHPSQTCFLSSVDMHCQLSYQIMMPNAIAIVHAPTDKTLVFSLTKDGISMLSKCNCQGFHRHEGISGLYSQAKHVKYDNRIKVKFIDIRKR